MTVHLYLAHHVKLEHLRMVREVQHLGSEFGVMVNVADYKLLPGLSNSRREAIRSSDAMLAVVTSPSPHVDAEIGCAAEAGAAVIIIRRPGVKVQQPAGAVVLDIARPEAFPAALRDAGDLISTLVLAEGGDIVKAVITTLAAMTFALFSVAQVMDG